MNIFILVTIVSIVGCVPLYQYQNIEKRLSAQMSERNEMTQQMATCEEQNRNLKASVEKAEEAVKKSDEEMQKLRLSIPAIVPPIDQAELEEIKKRALLETEEKIKNNKKQ